MKTETKIHRRSLIREGVMDSKQRQFFIVFWNNVLSKKTFKNFTLTENVLSILCADYRTTYILRNESYTLGGGRSLGSYTIIHVYIYLFNSLVFQNISLKKCVSRQSRTQ